MQTHQDRDVSSPPAMADLDPGERLLVWAFRSWVSGTENRPVVRAEFHRQLAPRQAAVALRALEDLVDAIQGAACRVLHYHAPCCPCVGPDEMCVVTLVAAAQERNTGLARAAAHCLVCPDASEQLAVAAEALGDVLARHGLALPQRVRVAGLAAGQSHGMAQRVLH
jgi:hypothetical protein